MFHPSLVKWRAAWAESQQRKQEGDLDYFVPICNVERYLRKNHHNMIFNTTAVFGNTEVKRVYSWEEGTIGPMNSLLNMAGAQLRFLTMTRYPFPTPTKLTYKYTLRNGRVRTDTGFGYSGSNRSIKVILSHPTLQAMDFVDMIRAPVNELCRQCFIHSVFGNAARPYISLFIYRLRPFLDYLYTRSRKKTDSKTGVNGFVESIDEILDEVLDRIKVHHGKRSGQLKRVTQTISDDIQTKTVHLTADDISESLKYFGYSKSVWWGLSYLRSNLFEWRLPHAAREVLRQYQDRNPTLMHRFGNYVVMVLSYLQEKRGAFGLDQLENLWDAIRPWILMQLGGKQPQNDMPKTIFNMSSVFRNLKTRVACMDRIPPSEVPIFDEVRYGIKVDSNLFDEESQSGHQWYIFEKAPYNRELIAGCVSATSRDIESQTIILLNEQAEIAERSHSNRLVIPIIIAKTLGNPALYEPISDSDYPYQDPDDIDYTELEWRFVGHLRYGTRQSGALARLRWITTKWYAAFPEIVPESLPRRPHNTTRHMFDYLDRIATELSDIESVTIEVSGKPDKGTIQFFDSDKDECGSLEYHRISEAVRILRTPYDLGQPLVVERTLVTWNPAQSISFSHNLKHFEKDVLRGIL